MNSAASPTYYADQRDGQQTVGVAPLRAREDVHLTRRECALLSARMRDWLRVSHYKFSEKEKEIFFTSSQRALAFGGLFGALSAAVVSRKTTSLSARLLSFAAGTTICSSLLISFTRKAQWEAIINQTESPFAAAAARSLADIRAAFPQQQNFFPRRQQQPQQPQPPQQLHSQQPQLHQPQLHQPQLQQFQPSQRFSTEQLQRQRDHFALHHSADANSGNINYSSNNRKPPAAASLDGEESAHTAAWQDRALQQPERQELPQEPPQWSGGSNMEEKKKERDEEANGPQGSDSLWWLPQPDAHQPTTEEVEWKFGQFLNASENSKCATSNAVQSRTRTNTLEPTTSLPLNVYSQAPLSSGYRSWAEIRKEAAHSKQGAVAVYTQRQQQGEEPLMQDLRQKQEQQQWQQLQQSTDNGVRAIPWYRTWEDVRREAAQENPQQRLNSWDKLRHFLRQ